MGWWNCLTDFINVREGVELRCWKVKKGLGRKDLDLSFFGGMWRNWISSAAFDKFHLENCGIQSCTSKIPFPFTAQSTDACSFPVAGRGQTRHLQGLWKLGAVSAPLYKDWRPSRPNVQCNLQRWWPETAERFYQHTWIVVLGDCKDWEHTEDEGYR